MDGIHKGDPLQSIEEMEISAEEREQVLAQIESAVAQAHAPDRTDLAVLEAEKKGLLFPLLINIAAVVLIGCGVFLLVRHFELRKDNITLRRRAYVSAEGTLIQTLKQETESQLQAKEQEISSIQERLQAVERERQALKLKLEADLESKQEELRSQLREELREERSRLTALGTSEANISNKLRELESRQQGAIDEQIARYRRQLDAQLQERESELLASETRAREALEQANRERDQLLAELSEQEAERSTAEKQLRELTDRVQSEALLRNQAAVIFRSVWEHLQVERFDAALRDLQGLKDNNQVQTDIVAMLEDLIRSRQNAGIGSGSSTSSPSAASAATASADEAAIAALEEQLNDKKEEIEELQDQIRAIVAASASETNRDAVLARQLQDRIDSLNAQLRSDEARIRQLSSQVKAAETSAEQLKFELQSLSSSSDQASERGRDDALRDVITYLNLLSETGDHSAEAEDQLTALARRDPLFRAATREIRILIAGGASAELASPYRFLGIVSSVSSGRAVIEAMVDLDISAGSEIQIRRISELDREIAVAEGTVQQVRGGKITATFKPVSSDDRGPEARDPVYVFSGGS
jgi:hypothetical protein